MRLTCPSCQSEYDIDAAAIGAMGRMVRCANCGGEWFQAPEASATAEAPEPMTVVTSAPEPEAPPAEASYGEAEHGYRIIEEEPARGVQFDAEPEIERSFPAQDAPEPSRFSEARDTGALTASLHDNDDLRPAAGKGAASFIGGFATSAVLVGLFVAVYMAAPGIIRSVPALEPAMAGYVQMVDQGRTVLNVLAGG